MELLTLPKPASRLFLLLVLLNTAQKKWTKKKFPSLAALGQRSFHVVHCLFNYRDKLNRKFIRWHRVAFFKQRKSKRGWRIEKKKLRAIFTLASCKCGRVCEHFMHGEFGRQSEICVSLTITQTHTRAASVFVRDCLVLFIEFLILSLLTPPSYGLILA